MVMAPRQPENKPGKQFEDFGRCETWIESIVLRSPIPQFVADREHRILFWNKALEKYSGIKSKDVIGTDHHWKAFYPDKRPCLLDLLIDEKEDRIPELYKGKYNKSRFVEGAYEAIDFFPHMGQSGIWLHFTAALIRDESGDIIGAVETLEDITERKKAEDELRRSEDRFRELFNSMKSGVAVYRAVDDGKDFEFVDFNHGAEIIENLNKKDIIGRRVTEVFPGVREFGLLEVFRSVWSTGIPKNHPVSQYKDERIESWRENFVYRLPSGEIVAIYEDATEPKKAEEAIRESEKKYRNLVENISDVILAIDVEGKITYISPVIEKIYGYTPDEIIGQYFMKFVHPEDLPAVKEGFQHRLKGEYGENTLRIIAKDGSERFVRTTQTPIIHQGSVTGFNYIMNDYTERIRAEEALKTSEKKYRDLVENISDVIFTLRTDGIVTYISPVVERLYGYTQDEIIGKPFASFIHPDDLYKVTDLFDRYFKGEDFNSSAYIRALASDGTARFVRANPTPVIDEGDIKEFNFIITDYTDRKKTEEALSTANNKLNMLSSITRHDILNMIMVIRGYLEISEDIEKDPQIQEYLAKESEAVDVIQRQIEFTRYYQDIGMKEPGWHDAGEVFIKTANSMDLEGVKVENTVSGVKIFADPLIEKVFYNLIDNSIRHAGKFTTIGLACSESADNLVIRYFDDGVGISDKDREKLFQKGFGKNTGLGLFLSREILSITGITITENGKEGEGVNFEIKVPKGTYRFDQ